MGERDAPPGKPVTRRYRVLDLIETAADGVVEAIVSGEGRGVLAPAGDHGKLALAAIEMLRYPTRARRLAEAGRRWLEHNLSHERMAATIEATYAKLLSSSRGRACGE